MEGRQIGAAYLATEIIYEKIVFLILATTNKWQVIINRVNYNNIKWYPLRLAPPAPKTELLKGLNH